MDFFKVGDESASGSTWSRVENYVKQERQIQPVQKIVIKGAVEVVFRRSDKPQLVVAAEFQEALESVFTSFKGGKLVIEQETVNILPGDSGSFTRGNNVFHGGVGQVIMGEMTFSGGKILMNKSIGRVVVGIALPEAPTISIKGSGDATLIDLDQADLKLRIQGSGDIAASGKVEYLDVEIAGSGDVDASQLVADQAELYVSGSGEIDALVRNAVHASVQGSGDIVVRGNPATRNSRTLGTGKIKFR